VKGRVDDMVERVFVITPRIVEMRCQEPAVITRSISTQRLSSKRRSTRPQPLLCP
jgi:hypothetical protein